MSAERARRIIEHLRSGVPSPEVASALSVGRQGLLRDIERDLASLADGSRTRSYRIIAANYGDGKSHMLNAARKIAEDMNFLVSTITISRETPLGRPVTLYPKVIARTYSPGVTRPGIDALLRTLENNPEAAQRLLRFADHRLHAKICRVLEARFEGRGEGAEALEADLSGYFISAASLRSGYRQNLSRVMPKTDRFRQDQASDYFRLVDQMSSLGGYSGWVLLVDELEMIARYTKRQRTDAYRFIDTLIKPGMLPHTYTLFALASSFQGDLLERQDEINALPAWLVSRGQDDVAEIIRPIIKALAHTPSLPPLSDDDLAQAFNEIIKSHFEAYRWQAPLSAMELLGQVRKYLPERDSKIRQLVRAAIQILDHLHLYGEAPSLSLNPLTEPTIVAGKDEEDSYRVRIRADE